MTNMACAEAEIILLWLQAVGYTFAQLMYETTDPNYYPDMERFEADNGIDSQEVCDRGI